MRIVSLKEAPLLLSKGELLGYPTDTVWGIGGLPRQDIISKINSFKRRQNKAGFILITDDATKLAPFVRDADDLTKITTTIEPTSWLVYASPSYSFLTTNDKVAFRIITKPPILLSLLASIDVPLISTSLNISGQPTPTAMSEIHFDLPILPFEKRLDNKPSTLIDLYSREILRY